MNFTNSVHPMAYAPGFRLRIRLVAGLRPGAGIAGHRRDLRHPAFRPLSRFGSRLGARGLHGGNTAAALTSASAARRALGIQNTGQNLMAAATPPVIAALAAVDGYPAAFAVAAVLPLAAAALVPVAALEVRTQPA